MPRDLRSFAEGFLTEQLGGNALRHLDADPPALRQAIDPLLPPDALDHPWLLVVAADRWLLDGEAKKEARGRHLVREDLEALRPLLAAHVRSGQPGAAAIFVHAADAQHARSFRTNVLRLADRLGLERAVLGIDAAEDTRDLAVVMTSREDLAAETAEAWHSVQAEG